MSTENESTKDEGELSAEKLDQISGGVRLTEPAPIDEKDRPVYTHPIEGPILLP